MTCVVHYSELQQPCALHCADYLVVDLPRSEKLPSELVGLGEVDAIDPFHRSWGLDYEIVLSVVDKHRQAFVKQLLDQVNLGLHEVCEEVVVDIFRLAVVDDLRIKSVESLEDGFVSEVRLQNLWVTIKLP